MRIAYYDNEGNTKVCFANPGLLYMLKELQDYFLNYYPKKTQHTNPSFPFTLCRVIHSQQREEKWI